MDNRIDAIYGRQSIDKKDSISIESQFEFCRYELKGGEGREYKDKGYSGKNIERPDFQRLLQDIKLGLIKRVIVYKLDRISRSIVDFAKLMELFKQYNVEFVSCTEKFDTSTPMGRAMLNICIVFAQLERESIQMRVQDAFYSRCTKGYYMRGRTPYGFDRLKSGYDDWDEVLLWTLHPDDPSPAKAASSPGWLPLDAEHWPEEGALVVLSYPTGLGGSAYLTARCCGGVSDQYPFISTDAGISVQDIVECQCDSWLLISERQRGRKDDCEACKASHPQCNKCCKACDDPCNAAQWCRKDEK